MAVDSAGKQRPPLPKDITKNPQVISKPRDNSRKPKDITNTHQDIMYKSQAEILLDSSFYENQNYTPKYQGESRLYQGQGHIQGQHYSKHYQGQGHIPLHNQAPNDYFKMEINKSDNIQIASHKLEPIHLNVPKSDSIQVTSHKITDITPPKIADVNNSPAQRLLRKKQEVTEKPPEVYLLDLDEVKVHKVKRIFKIGSNPNDDASRRCLSEDRSKRRTWHSTDTDRSTRSDGDVVTGRAARTIEDFPSPLAAQERPSRSRQRKSAFMESIHSFFHSRKTTSSPLKYKESPSSDDLHVARAQGGAHCSAQKPPVLNERLRHLAEESSNKSEVRLREKSASPSGREVLRAQIKEKSSSLPPNQPPPQDDDKNHVIFGMGEKTFNRFSKYLTVYDAPPESRV